MVGWFDIAATSEYCCTGKRTIEIWIKEKDLRIARIRGKRLIKKEWLDEFLEQHEVKKNNEIDTIVNEVMKDIG